MREVSQAGEDVLMQLIAWEMFGRDDLDPKRLLRQLSLADLSLVQCNINESAREVKKFVSVQMVELELLYRRGFLVGDWTFERMDECVSLTFDPGMPTSKGMREATAARA